MSTVGGDGPAVPADRLTGEYVSNANPVIIGGCGRSGTTLLRVMLDSHRNVCCGPESELFLPKLIRPQRLARYFDVPPAEFERLYRGVASRGEFIDLFFASYCHRTDKRRWGEKTPRNVTRLQYIFTLFPRARFINVIRDGRDVVCSLRTHPRYKVIDGRLVPANTRKPLEECITRWVHDVEASRPFWTDPRYMEVRYEDLVDDPGATLRRLLRFIDEPWDERMLRYHEVDSNSRDVTKFPQNPEATRPLTPDSIGRWQWELSAKELATFRRLAGSLLAELGYATKY